MHSYSVLQAHPREFFRLFGLPLPVPDNHEHYLAMWMQHDIGMAAKVYFFNKYLDWCEKQGYSSPQNYRADYAGPKIIEWLRNTGIVEKFDSVESNKPLAAKKDNRNNAIGELLLSIDIVKANYTALHVMAHKAVVTIPSSWEELCASLGIYPFLAESKMFRQHVFGNHHPNMYTSVQRRIISGLRERLEVDEKDVVYLSHDEIAIRYPKDGIGGTRKRINNIMGLGGPIQFRLTPYQVDPAYDIQLDLKSESPDLLRQLEEVEQEKRKVASLQRYEDAAKLRDREREIRSELGELYGKQLEAKSIPINARLPYGVKTEFEMKNGKLEEVKKSLVNIPSNKFYSYFRSMLLKELLQPKDTQFVLDGDLAQWIR